MFAGAGGGILADLLLGQKTIGAIEIETYPRQVLIERQLDGSLPQFPIWDDVRTFSHENPDTRSYIDWLRERCDSLVIAAGFPCQDISVAGKQAGLGEGTRSGLYREVLRFTEKSCELLMSLNPSTSSWKMCRQSSLWEETESDKSSPTFPRWGMTLNGLLYEHPMSVRRITGTGGGTCVPDGQTFHHTPNTTGLDGGSNSRKALKARQEKYPTPTVLAGTAQMYPTPAARDWKDNWTHTELARDSTTLATIEGGVLNPRWVEWLMGWPIGWTQTKQFKAGGELSRKLAELPATAKTEQPNSKPLETVK